MQDVQRIFDQTRKFLDGKLDFVASAICAHKKDQAEASLGTANEGLSRVKAAPDEVSGRPSRSGIGDRKSLRVRVDQAIAPSTEKHEKPFDELLDKIVISLAATWSIMQACLLITTRILLRLLLMLLKVLRVLSSWLKLEEKPRRGRRGSAGRSINRRHSKATASGSKKSSYEKEAATDALLKDLERLHENGSVGERNANQNRALRRFRASAPSASKCKARPANNCNTRHDRHICAVSSRLVNSDAQHRHKTSSATSSPLYWNVSTAPFFQHRRSRYPAEQSAFGTKSSWDSSLYPGAELGHSRRGVSRRRKKLLSSSDRSSSSSSLSLSSSSSSSLASSTSIGSSLSSSQTSSGSWQTTTKYSDSGIY